MLESKYTLDAGRSIKRDGLPFVHIARSYTNTRAEGYGFPATDADTFAHYATAAPALIEFCRTLRAGLRELGFHDLEREISGADTVDAMAQHYESLCAVLAAVDAADAR